MKKIIFITAFAAMAVIIACGGDETKTAPGATNAAPKSMVPDPPKYDPNRGEGKFNHVELGDKLNDEMATKGNDIFGVKCSACHKLTDEKLVGPGWKGVTERRKPDSLRKSSSFRAAQFAAVFVWNKSVILF